MLNSVIMTGRMVADPELRTTQSDIKVTSFRIAVTRNYKVNDEYPSDFFTVVAWRNTAEFAAKHFKKGDTSEQNTAPVPDDFEPIEDEFPDFPG